MKRFSTLLASMLIVAQCTLFAQATFKNPILTGMNPDPSICRVRDDFNGNTLNLYWNFLRNPYAKDWSLTEKPGFLRLKGSELNFTQNDSPAFVGRRQTAFEIKAFAKISFNPAGDNEEAGLVVRADDKNHYDLLITRYHGKRVVMLRKYLQDKVAEVKYKEIPVGDIVLSGKSSRS